MSTKTSEAHAITDLVSFAEEVVGRALEAGADDAEVYLRKGRESEVEVRNGLVERLVEGQPTSVGIRLWKGDRSSSSMATQLDWGTVDGLIRDTLEMASFSDEVPEQALPEKRYLATEIPSLSLYDESIAARPTSEKIERLRRIEDVAMQEDERLTVSGGARYGDHDIRHALATSRGFAEGFEETMVSSYIEVIADDDDGKKRNGGWFDVARFYNEQLDEQELIDRAVRRAVGHLGSKPMSTGKRPVVFDPYAAASLFRDLFKVLTGAAIERGSSFLADSLGDQIASSNVNLYDDPLRVGGIGSRPFDGEGLPAKKAAFVEDGVLKSFALNSYHARKLSMEPTGHASRPKSGAPGETYSNLYLEPGEVTPKAIIAEIDDGFYCESMMGFGFNPANGDFSRGASGYRIENGEITTPVSEVTLSLSMQEILTGISQIANDLRFDRSISAPHIRVDGMTIAGS